MRSFTEKIKTLEWKKVLFFSVLAILIQDVLIERLIPLIFMDSTIDYNYVAFMKTMQFLIYISLCFYLCRNVDENKFLHSIAFLITASVISSVLFLIIQSIRTLDIPTTLLLSLFNLLMIFYLLIPVLVGYFSQRIYSRIFPEKSPFFMKLIFPVSVFIGVVTLIPYLIEPELGIIYSSLNGAPAFLLIPITLLSMKFSLFALLDFYSSPLSLLWIVIIYYTFFFFVAGLFYLRFKKTRHIRWTALIALMILLHFFSVALMYFMITMSGG
ncbi:hypothetical protein KY338_00205 [Candidatus Woesearchaeota archaeon]|nr:hypothetical protein [Candidatus Woesearchaeota archaeon]MBW3005256.1 hypothetical protein [Candidatus Woesearchaeota archaeon]